MKVEIHQKKLPERISFGQMEPGKIYEAERTGSIVLCTALGYAAPLWTWQPERHKIGVAKPSYLLGTFYRKFTGTVQLTNSGDLI